MTVSLHTLTSRHFILAIIVRHHSLLSACPMRVRNKSKHLSCVLVCRLVSTLPFQWIQQHTKRALGSHSITRVLYQTHDDGDDTNNEQKCVKPYFFCVSSIWTRKRLSGMQCNNTLNKTATATRENQNYLGHPTFETS